MKQLTELHGGEVRARSPGPGKGSTFILSLPLVAAHPHPARSAAAERNASVDARVEAVTLKGIKVLSIDDDADSADVIARILRSHHAEVRSASCMEEGLELVAAFEPDVILSDIGMPGHDGYEFVQRLRTMQPARPVAATHIRRPRRRLQRSALRSPLPSFRSSSFGMHLSSKLCFGGREKRPARSQHWRVAPGRGCWLRLRKLELLGHLHSQAGARERGALINNERHVIPDAMRDLSSGAGCNLRDPSLCPE